MKTTYQETLQLVRDLSEHRLKAEPGRKVFRGPVRCGAEMRGIIARHCRPKVVQMPERFEFDAEEELVQPRWMRCFERSAADYVQGKGRR